MSVEYMTKLIKTLERIEPIVEWYANSAPLGEPDEITSIDLNQFQEFIKILKLIHSGKADCVDTALEQLYSPVDLTGKFTPHRRIK
jgi:hypothetical protein